MQRYTPARVYTTSPARVFADVKTVAPNIYNTTASQGLIAGDVGGFQEWAARIDAALTGLED